MNFKTVLLAAAALGVAGSAQAADLAKKAPAAANYVKVCDAYGAGFFYIPGSDTCLKIGGYVRAEYLAFSTNRAFNDAGVGWNTRGANGIATHARANLNFDARTNTEMGLLRSFIDLEINNWSYGNGTTNAAGLAAGVTLNKAFVQFGGLTAGRATSFFDFYTGTTWGTWFEASHSDTNINLLAYTFTFGNGISASLSIEDPSSGSAGRRHGTNLNFINALGSYAGVKVPDLVANVNITQAWGSAQVMGALHQNYSLADDRWGYAVGAGVTVNLPMLGEGDTVNLQAVYAKGAIDYVSPNWGGILVSNGTLNANDFAMDFRNPTGTRIEQTTAWSVAAGLTHNWTKSVSTSLNASYASFDMPLMAVADFKQIDVQGNVVWTPVSNLSIGAELEYRRLDYSAASGLADANALAAILRVQRSF